MNSILVLLPLLLSFSFFQKEKSLATNESNFTNLIVLAKFKGEDEFIDSTLASIKERDLIDNMYNNSEYSVKSYYQSVSNNNINMNSIFLFDEGNSITLEKERGYYASYSDQNPIGFKDASERNIRNVELLSDWTNKVNEAILKENCLSNRDNTKHYSLSELDKNNDGYIDCITIIYKSSPSTISVDWSDPLWNYETENYGVNVQKDGVSLSSRSYVQLTHSSTTVYQDSSSLPFTSVGTAIHEMGHIFGLKDLYVTSNERYVYYMPPMDKHLSPIPQYLSFKEREALGWVDSTQSKKITSNGDYTIHVTKDVTQNETICYKLDLKNGHTIYMEYRDFSTANNRFDSQSKELPLLSDGYPYRGLTIKSGLVLFQVDSNIKFPSNLYSSNITYRVLGGTYQTKNDAALGLYDYYEDGNDLFQIEVMEMNEETITFNIQSNELFNDIEESSIEITSYPSSLKRGDTYQCIAAITGEDSSPIWSIENNTSDKTAINHNGLLAIGDDENSSSIEIIAKTQDGKEDRKTINLVIEHSLEHHEHKEPTCEEDGSKEYYYCEECNLYFLDNAHKVQIDKNDLVIPALGHDEEVIGAIPSTCTEEGKTESIICKRCGKTIKEGESLPKSPHTRSEWIIKVEPTTEKEGIRYI